MRKELLIAMREQNIKSKQLAAEINVSQSFMSQIVTGQRNPRLEIAIRIANRLGKSVDELFDTIERTGTEG